MEQQQSNERRRPVIYPLQIPLESRIRFVSETDPDIYQRYGVQQEAAVEEEIPEEEPELAQLEVHQTAEILCKLSDSPTIHMSPASDPLRFLTEATRYTIRPIYPPICFPTGQGIISYPLTYSTSHAYPYPVFHAQTQTSDIPAIGFVPPISEEEWVAITAPELPPPLATRTCGSPVVEEFLQTYFPPEIPAEDRQGWYEFLCEDGGNEDCWSKFLGNDSGTEVHEWGHQDNV